MKQFSLEEYLKNPERKIATRDGRPVRIICTDAKNSRHPIVALVFREDKEYAYTYPENGRFENISGNYDLFFAPQIQKRWGIMTGDNRIINIYSSKEDAKNNVVNPYNKVVKITWEE